MSSSVKGVSLDKSSASTSDSDTVSVLHDQDCPICKEKKATMTEIEQDVPFFGKTFIFSVRCSACGYKKSDVEGAEQRPPVKLSFTVEKVEDLKVRIVKSSGATVRFGRLGSIESGVTSDGYVTNVEGLIERFKKVVETLRDTEEDDDTRKKAKNTIKRLQNALWGHEPLQLTIDDPSGNSAIISDKTVKK